MCALSSSSGSDNFSQISDQNRDTGTYHQVDVVKQAINKANEISILDIFHHYGVELDGNKSCCPFPFHKNGQEHTPSFFYYPNRNGFNCYGCKNGGGTVDFVALYEGKSKYSAAQLILSNTGLSKSFVPSTEDYQQRQNAHLEFSHSIREFITHHPNDERAFIFAEELCSTFDKLHIKYELSVENTMSIINKLIKKANNYQCQLF